MLDDVTLGFIKERTRLKIKLLKLEEDCAGVKDCIGLLDTLIPKKNKIIRDA